MTQWSGPPGGPGGGGPPQQYGSPYGPPSSPYGRKPPRETGALVTCIVLLVLALIGAFVASAVVFGKLTDDSSATSRPGSVTGGGAGVATGGSEGTAPAGGATSAPGTSRDDIVKNFPVYPGARRVSSAKPYLAPGGVYNRAAVNYVAPAKVATVYNWYRAHLPEDHLRFSSPVLNRDYDTHKVDYVFAGVTNADDTVDGQFDIEKAQKPGTCVLVVYIYD